MQLRNVALLSVAASCVLACVAVACGSFSGTDASSAGADGGEAGSLAGDASAAGDASGSPDGAPAVTFFCPAPANECVFAEQIRCLEPGDGGTVGACHAPDHPCPTGSFSAVSCDAPAPCKALLDSSDAVCCMLNSDVTKCAPHLAGCPTEACQGTSMLAECADAAATCVPSSGGYGYCQ